MTVNPILAYAIAWAFSITLFLTWFFSSKLAAARDALDTQLAVNAHNLNQHALKEALLVSGILERAQIKKLPVLNVTKWRALQDLYDAPDLLPHNIPAQVTTDHDDRPTVYWKIDNVNELTAYEVARLWLAGVL